MNLKLFLLFYAIAFFTTSKVVAQSDLFTPDNGSGRSSLSSEIRAKLLKIEIDSNTKYMAYFKVGKISKLQKKGKLKFSLPNVNGQLTAVSRKIEAFSDDNYFWEGVIEGGFGTITIRCENGLTFGFVHYLNGRTETDEVYSIYGLTNDLSVMVQSRRKGKCGMVNSANPRGISDNRTTPTVESRSVAPCSSSGIRVLVLSTANARNGVANISQCAQMGVDQFNAAATNSGIYNTHLVLANVIDAPNFTSLGEIRKDLEIVKNDIGVQNLRNAVNADIVVLLTCEDYARRPDGDGEAWDIDARNADAYAAADIKAFEGFVFTHEVAHLMGARHESDLSSTTNSAGDPTPAYNHGFSFGPHWFSNNLQYGTVMHDLLGPTRLNQFSNPNVTHSGFATGTTNTNNVARRIVETTQRISNYRPEPNISVHISGNNTIFDYGIYYYDAIASCGLNDSYYWIWEGSTDGFSFTPIPSSNGIMTYDYYQGGPRWEWLKVTVFDNQGRSNYCFFPVFYDGNALWRITNNVNSPYSVMNSHSNAVNGDNPFSNINIYPNPAQNTLTTEFEINNSEPVVFKLLDVQGREVIIDTDESLSKGRRSKKLDISKVPTGIYILKINSGESSVIEKVTIQK